MQEGGPCDVTPVTPPWLTAALIGWLTCNRIDTGLYRQACRAAPPGAHGAQPPGRTPLLAAVRQRRSLGNVNALPGNSTCYFTVQGSTAAWLEPYVATPQ